MRSHSSRSGIAALRLAAAAAMLAGASSAFAADDSVDHRFDRYTQLASIGPMIPAANAAARASVNQIGLISPFPVHARIGAMVSPRTKFAGGLDVTVPGLQVLPNFTSRFTAEAIVGGNFGGFSTLVPLTFDQVYSKGLLIGSRIYGGGGIGLYIGDRTRFGGKLFVGAELAQRLGAELSVHFAGQGDPLVILQARLGL